MHGYTQQIVYIWLCEHALVPRGESSVLEEYEKLVALLQ